MLSTASSSARCSSFKSCSRPRIEWRGVESCTRFALSARSFCFVFVFLFSFFPARISGFFVAAAAFLFDARTAVTPSTAGDGHGLHTLTLSHAVTHIHGHAVFKTSELRKRQPRRFSASASGPVRYAERLRRRHSGTQFVAASNATQLSGCFELGGQRTRMTQCGARIARFIAAKLCYFSVPALLRRHHSRNSGRYA